jgi:hypothetical protein
MGAFGVLSRQIVSELIDGEAVILDLRTGRYHTTDGVGAAVWRAASDGMDLSAIVASCRACFPDQPGIEDDIAALLDSLVGLGLLTPVDRSADSNDHGPQWPATYESPRLDSYDNLADMMALDPIHDVDAVGWPSPGAVADRW